MAKKKIDAKETPVEKVSKKPVDRQGLFVVAVIVLLAGAAAFYFYSGSNDSEEYDTKSSIIVYDQRFVFRNNISDLASVDMFPNKLHVLEASAVNRQYYTIQFSNTCQEKQECGTIGIAAFDIARAMGTIYAAGGSNYVSVAGNDSVTYFLQKEYAVLDKSKLKGLEIVLITPGESNRTMVSAYADQTDSLHRVIIEGTNSTEFLRAVDAFNYLILRDHDEYRSPVV